MFFRQSFALRAGVENYVGGQIAYGPDGKSVDTAPLAEEGAILTVTSEMQANALRQAEVLKEVKTPGEHQVEVDEEDAVLIWTPESSDEDDEDDSSGETGEGESGATGEGEGEPGESTDETPSNIDPEVGEDSREGVANRRGGFLSRGGGDQ